MAADAHLDEVLDSIRIDTIVGDAQELIRRASVNPPGDYGAVVEWVTGRLKGIGLDVAIVEGDPGRPNVVGAIPGSGSGESLVLSSHTDVVGEGDHSAWTHPPFAATVADGHLWGRGAADSKGQLAAMIAAVEAIKRSGRQLSGDLYLTAPVDDENAGPRGLRYIFSEGAVSADSVIYGEATDLVVQHVFKARLWFELLVKGRSAHGAFPERGINAIDKAYAAIQAIRGIPLEDHPLVGRDTVNIGKIEGGEQVNVVCGTCRVWFDVRWGPTRRSADIKRAVHAALDELKRQDPEFEHEDLVITEDREPLEFGADSPLIRAIDAGHRAVVGREVSLNGWYSSGELWPLWEQRSIKSGVVFGPGKPWQAHAIDERIQLDELLEGARVYAATALSLCR